MIPKHCRQSTYIPSERLKALLEKSMQIFSDKLHIKHDSVLQQEG